MEYTIKRFIDDHAIERIEIVKQPPHDVFAQLNKDRELGLKIDALGWLGRSAELVSPYLSADMIKSFKLLVSQPEDKHKRQTYIKA